VYNEKSDMSPHKLFSKIEKKQINIALAISALDLAFYHDSPLGKKIYKNIENTYHGNMHLTIKNSLICYLLIEIVKLFDADERSISFETIIKAMKENPRLASSPTFIEAECMLRKMKEDSRFAEIKRKRHNPIAHTSKNTSDTKLNFDNINGFYEDLITPFFEKLFSALNDGIGISKKEFTKQGKEAAKTYFSSLLFGLEHKLEFHKSPK